ncbi:hypothetical protein DFJ73DRAFT_838024 [Zopfochytrium polystomum]|nr:hypothetical protein DFJ73DRAFT_838024 [Zopfochytrium polystomum]
MASPANRDDSEGIFRRLARNAAANPFVVPGVAMTGYAFYTMTVSGFTKDVAAFQRGQRNRVAAQLATIAVAIAGVMYNDHLKQERKRKAAEEAAVAAGSSSGSGNF